MDFQHAGQEGAAIEIGEDGAQHDLADRLTSGVAFGPAQKIGYKISVFEQELLETLALDISMEIGLHGGKDGGEQFLVDEFGEGLGAVFAEPQDEVGAGGALSDELARMIGEGIAFSLGHEKFKNLAAQAGFGGAQEFEGALLPVFRECRRERLEDACILGGGNLAEDFREFGR